MIDFPLLAGTIASMLHVISGPDHLAAVTPLIIETKKKSWKIGISWGLGHLSGMLIIGILFLFFKEFIPIELISSHSEQIVSFILIGVGLWSFYRINNEPKKHFHPHVHKDKETYIHIHKHEHSANQEHQHIHVKIIKQNLLSSFGIGIVHGLAGVAHFLLLIPVLGFNDKIEGIQYIIGFAAGTLLSMTTYAFIVGKISSYSKHFHNDLFFKGIRFAGGLFALVIGVYWFFSNS
ncbi:hypothetical protein [Lutibacter sp.]